MHTICSASGDDSARHTAARFLAKCAFQAAIRGTDDIIALLSDMPNKQYRPKNRTCGKAADVCQLEGDMITGGSVCTENQFCNIGDEGRPSQRLFSAIGRSAETRHSSGSNSAGNASPPRQRLRSAMQTRHRGDETKVRFSQYRIDCNYFSADLADSAAADRTLSFRPRSTLICFVEGPLLSVSH
jgi:hypothetical protein